MLPMFYEALSRGAMATDGEPRITKRESHHAMMDGQMLPGPVVMRRAVQLAMELATDTPVRKNGVQIGRVQSVQLLEDSGIVK